MKTFLGYMFLFLALAGCDRPSNEAKIRARYERNGKRDCVVMLRETDPEKWKLYKNYCERWVKDAEFERKLMSPKDQRDVAKLLEEDE